MGFLTSYPIEVLWVAVSVALIFMFLLQGVKDKAFNNTLDRLSAAIDKLADALDDQRKTLEGIDKRLTWLEAKYDNIKPGDDNNG